MVTLLSITERKLYIISGHSLQPLRDFAVEANVSSPAPMHTVLHVGGKSDLTRDVILYPNSTIHYIASSVLCRLQ
jgi:hypothetical protein